MPVHVPLVQQVHIHPQRAPLHAQRVPLERFLQCLQVVVQHVQQVPILLLVQEVVHPVLPGRIHPLAPQVVQHVRWDITPLLDLPLVHYVQLVLLQMSAVRQRVHCVL